MKFYLTFCKINMKWSKKWKLVIAFDLSFFPSFFLSHSLGAELHKGFFLIYFWCLQFILNYYFFIFFLFILVLFLCLWHSLKLKKYQKNCIRIIKIKENCPRADIKHNISYVFHIFFFRWCLVELSNHIFVNAIFKCIYFMFYFLLLPVHHTTRINGWKWEYIFLYHFLL